MKHLVAIFFVLSVLNMLGCATSTYTMGKEFSTDQVKNIERGKTTSAELNQMFGEPYKKMARIQIRSATSNGGLV